MFLSGPGGSGKSTVVAGLRARGYRAFQVSQEHSGVPDLWRRRHPQSLLVYLEASNEVLRQRYSHLNLTDAYLAEERRRLQHARKHADCSLVTDDLTPDEIVTIVIRRLNL